MTHIQALIKHQSPSLLAYAHTQRQLSLIAGVDVTTVPGGTATIVS
jgi:hypothetical protein